MPYVTGTASRPPTSEPMPYVTGMASRAPDDVAKDSRAIGQLAQGGAGRAGRGECEQDGCGGATVRAEGPGYGGRSALGSRHDGQERS
jgi:hypothetical protein